MTRPDGRAADELRPISFERDYTEMAAGSCLVTVRSHARAVHGVDRRGRAALDARQRQGLGDRRVLDAPRIVARADRPRGGARQAERAHGRDPAPDRSQPAGGVRHDDARRTPGDRRLRRAAGRRRHAHGERSAAATWRCTTRSARVVQRGALTAHPLHSFCSAISVGIVGGVPVLDLPYVEDSAAEVDMNVVMLTPVAGGEPRFVEVQGTAEGMAFTRGELDSLLGLAERRPGRDHRPAARDGGGATAAAMTRRALRLVCASANPDKVAEIAAILGDAVELLPRPADVPDVVEDADTLEGNARLKAVAICDATGIAAVADDTGLEVDRARRRARRVRRALRRRGLQLRRQPPQAAARARRRGRPARPVPHGGAGAVAGRVGARRRRRVPGHDQRCRAWRARLRLRRRCSFPTSGDGRTFAEMSEAEKNAVSHRGRAFRNLLAALDA